MSKTITLNSALSAAYDADDLTVVDEMKKIANDEFSRGATSVEFVHAEGFVVQIFEAPAPVETYEF